MRSAADAFLILLRGGAASRLVSRAAGNCSVGCLLRHHDWNAGQDDEDDCRRENGRCLQPEPGNYADRSRRPDARAVVRSSISRCLTRTMIAPAPRKPIPCTTPCRTRDMSSIGIPLWRGLTTNSAAPMATSMWVRTPPVLAGGRKISLELRVPEGRCDGP